MLHYMNTKYSMSEYMKQLVANFNPLTALYPSSITQIAKAKGVRYLSIDFGTTFTPLMYHSLW
ncbi:hypothetical protein DAMA08_020990, partial (mitochondrion) [Martiniozyma asiatica (nom. inval.)]